MDTNPKNVKNDHPGNHKKPSFERTRSLLAWPRILLIIVITMAVTAGIAYWALSSYVFIKEFKPLELSAKEERVLGAKLKAVGVNMDVAGFRSKKSEPLKIKKDEYLIPQPYSEKGASGEISFNERELNALLAKNTNLGKKLAIDLANDLVSAKLLIPMEPDFPILGGKTIRVNAGVELAYKNGKPIIRLKGVSLWGAPIPNVWLGNLKNVDLASKFGGEQGFWKSFSEGVENIRVEEGQMKITLKK